MTTPTPTPPPPDWIRDRCNQRRTALDVSPEDIAAATGGQVTAKHVREYLAGRASMGSAKLQHVLDVLGLDIVIIGRVAEKAPRQQGT